MAYPCKFYKDGKEIQLDEVKKYIFDNYENIKSKSGVPPIEPPIENEEMQDDNITGGVSLQFKDFNKVKELAKKWADRVSEKWTEKTGKAFADLMNKYKGVKGVNGEDISITEAAKIYADDLYNRKVIKGEKFNIHSSDIPILSHLANEYHEQIRKATEANDAQTRDFFVDELSKLQEVVDNSDIGRTLQGLQMALKGKYDKDGNLQYEVAKKIYAKKLGVNVEDLDKKTEEKFHKIFIEEQEKLKEQFDLKEKQLKEQFENALADRDAEIKKSYEAGIEEGKRISGADKAKKMADNFRKKLKTKQLTFKDENGNEIPIQVQGLSWNDLVEIGAKAIEKTGKVIDGVNEVIEKIKDAEWYKKLSAKDKDNLENKIKTHFENSIREDIVKEDVLNAIKENADETSSTMITKDMVKSKMISDLIDSYLQKDTPKAEILDNVLKDLQKILPDVTKEQISDAFFREGEFKPETKKAVENELAKKRNKLKHYEIWDNKLKKLREDRQALSKLGKSTKKVDAEIELVKQEFKQELIESGIDISNDALGKNTALVEVSKSHNIEIDNLIKYLETERDNLVDTNAKDKIDTVINTLNSAKIKSVENIPQGEKTKINQLSELKQSFNTFFSKKYDLGLGKEKNAELLSKLREIEVRTKDKIEKVNDDFIIEQNIKNAQKQIDQYTKKIAKGDFEPQITTPKKKVINATIELSKIDNQLRHIKNEYKALQKEWIEKKRGLGKELLETGISGWHSFVLLSPTVFEHLVPASPLKIIWTSLTGKVDLLVNKLLPQALKINENIRERAMAGGETTHGYAKAFKMMIGNGGLVERAFLKLVKEKPKELKLLIEQKQNKAIDIAQELDKKIITATDETTKMALIEERNKALLDGVAYQSLMTIGENLSGTATKKLLTGSSSAEEIESGYHRSSSHLFEGVNDLKSAFDKLKSNINSYEDYHQMFADVRHLVNIVGRSHGLFKTPSQRFHFVLGFMARCEYELKKNPELGVDIFNQGLLSQKMLESIPDYHAGAYQQENKISKFFNKWIEESKNNPSTFIQSFGYLLDFLTVVRKIPLNQAKETIKESTFGTLTGIYDYNKIKRPIKQKAEMLFKNVENEAERNKLTQDYINESIGNINPDEAAAIIRQLRLGKIGASIALYCIFSSMRSGGSYAQYKEDKNRSKRILKPEEIEINGMVVNKLAWDMTKRGAGGSTALLVLNAKKAYLDAIENGDSKILGSIKSTLELGNDMVNKVPFTQSMLTKETFDRIEYQFKNLPKSQIEKWNNPLKDEKIELVNKAKRYIENVADNDKTSYRDIEYTNIKGEKIPTTIEERRKIKERRVQIMYEKYHNDLVNGVIDDKEGGERLLEKFKTYWTTALNDAKKEVFRDVAKRVGDKKEIHPEQLYKEREFFVNNYIKEHIDNLKKNGVIIDENGKKISFTEFKKPEYDEIYKKDMQTLKATAEKQADKQPRFSILKDKTEEEIFEKTSNKAIDIANKLKEPSHKRSHRRSHRRSNIDEREN